MECSYKNCLGREQKGLLVKCSFINIWNQVKEGKFSYPHRHSSFSCCSQENNLTCMKYCVQLRDITRREHRWELSASKTCISQENEHFRSKSRKRNMNISPKHSIALSTCFLSVLFILQGANVSHSIDYNDRANHCCHNHVWYA